jgi:trigger factor
VFKRELPALDDEFARSLGDYSDLEDLRSKLRVQLEANAAEDSRREFLDQIFEKLFDGVVEVAYPLVVIEEQLDRMVEDFGVSLRRQGMNLEDYLKMNSTSQDELRESFRATAVQQVERGLVLGKISEVENIVVTAEEIEDEIQTRLLSFGAQASLAKPLFDNPSMKHSISSRLLTDKTVERLIQIARGDSPEISQTDGIKPDDEKPKRKPTKKAKTPK